MKKIFLTTLLTLFLLTTLNAKEQWPSKLTFGIGHFGNQQKTKEAYSKIAKYLEKNLGIKIKVYRPSDQSAVVKGIKYGNIDISILGSKLYLKAKKEANIEVLVMENHKITKDLTYGILLSNKKFKWQKNKKIYKVVVPNKSSTCFPCLKEYLKSKKAKVSYSFSGSAMKSIQILKTDNVDLILVNNLFLSKFKDKNSFQVVWKSRTFPNFPIAISQKLPKSLKKSIKKLLVEYNDKKSLELLGLSGFKSVKDSDYDSLRKLLKI